MEQFINLLIIGSKWCFICEFISTSGEIEYIQESDNAIEIAFSGINTEIIIPTTNNIEIKEEDLGFVIIKDGKKVLYAEKI